MISIAIDGPSGAGKSTIARTVANQLGYMYVDTGALYRTVAYAGLQKGMDLSNPSDVASLLNELDLELTHDKNGEQRIRLNGKDVSDVIRSPEVSLGASQVSAVVEVREWLLETQRHLAENHNVIMDGRDIGTVVLPHATLKIFLTATPEARAKRRYLEYQEKGEEIQYPEVLKDIIERDRRDFTRAIAPLKQSEDAFLLDSTDFVFEETVAKLLEIININI